MKINTENYSNMNVPFKQSKNVLKCKMKKCVSEEHEKNTLNKLSKWSPHPNFVFMGN